MDYFLGGSLWTWLFLLAGVVSCLAIAFQDLRFRWVHVLPLALLAGSGLGFHLSGRTFNGTYLTLCLANLVMISLVFGLSALYIKLRGLRFLNHSLGLGDIVFVYALGCWLEPPLLFFCLGSGSIVVLVLALWRRGPWQKDSIPLAGCLAIWSPVTTGIMLLS